MTREQRTDTERLDFLEQWGNGNGESCGEIEVDARYAYRGLVSVRLSRTLQEPHSGNSLRAAIDAAMQDTVQETVPPVPLVPLSGG